METLTKTTPAFQAETVEGKVIVITGGTTGIGRAAALLLAGQGAKVLICGRHEPELNDTLADAEKFNVRENIDGIIADVGEKHGVDTLFREIEERFGTLDVLVDRK